MDNIELLQKTALFKGIGKEELDIALGLFQERHVDAGTTIFTEKMPAECLYIIKSGNVKITMMAGEGEEKTLLLLAPGEFFGELALLQEESRMVSARTETACELLLLSRKDFQALTELDPRSAVRLVTAMAKLLAIRVKAYSSVFRDMLIG